MQKFYYCEEIEYLKGSFCVCTAAAFDRLSRRTDLARCIRHGRFYSGLIFASSRAAARARLTPCGGR